jgi:hypothetical protein
MKVKTTVESSYFEGNEWIKKGRKWTCIIDSRHPEIKGCPLGRGKTEEEAVADLIYRVRIESHIDIEPEVSRRRIW